MAGTATFRVDASLQIGSGHVMRCLTLATALREQGVDCRFISREHPGNLIEQILARGFEVTALPSGDSGFQPEKALSAHAAWLGVDWQSDATATCDAMQSGRDWLVVDHYALARSWEQQLRPHCDRLMVIDDLADRPHDCDVLLDQNLGRKAADYIGLVPPTCTVLSDTRYALLRPQFVALREYSLERRASPRLRQLLVTMGGVDQFNATGRVLKALRECPLPEDCRIVVIMGLHAPWLSDVRLEAKDMPWPCEVMVNVTDMARLMADSDFAIGAAGSTSWERCALGLPTLMVILATNQYEAAANLQQTGAAMVASLDDLERDVKTTVASLSNELLAAQSNSAAALVDGYGISRVMKILRCGDSQ